MNKQQLGPQEKVLSIWAKNRLDERETIEWGAGALKTIRGQLGNDTAALFRFLDDHAQSSNIGENFTALWHLFRLVADDSGYADGFSFAYEFMGKAEQAKIRLEDIDELIQCLRPRLKVEPLSRYAEASESPLHWVRWDFETALGEPSQRSSYVGKQHLRHLSADLLQAIAEKGTSALQQALMVCKDIGWLGEGADTPNYTVHRVFESLDPDESDDDDKDPDTYNNSFAPLVRLLSSALSTLADKDNRLADRIVSTWVDLSDSSGLFLRLAAYASWNPKIRSNQKVGEFLTSIPNHPFWRWIVFPEVATLRATRWNELDEAARDALSKRLLLGPDDFAFVTDGEVESETKAFHRDHEIARLVDSGAGVDKRFEEIVAQRRASDKNFPTKVPALELGLPAASTSWAPPGKPDKFDDVPANELLAVLLDSHKSRGFGEGDDAEAFARTLNGKFHILEALALVKPSDPLFDPVFDLLLSFPNERAEDNVGDRDIAQRIVNLALSLSEHELANNAGRLCYWLDAIDERIPRLDNIEELWVKLLPLAENQANDKASTEHYSGESDLTMAALNEPLGHLLSFVLRRCHPIRDGKGSLPHDLFARLKQLSGRARELWANRMVVSMNYFSLVDEEWLHEIALDPMMQTGATSDRLWEAFARYSQIPSAKLWMALQTALLKRLYSPDITPDSKRRLSEICIIVWVWACRGQGYTMKAAGLRSALSLADDDVRAAAAWRFASIFFASKGDEKDNLPIQERWREVGHRFFDEVWPLEPTLQSAASANDFARIPVSVGPRLFADAVSIIAPFLVSFKVWSVKTAFRLDINEDTTKQIAQLNAEELLTLLSLSISDDQGNRVLDLGALLNLVSFAHPSLQGDYRIQRLRKMAVEPD